MFGLCALLSSEPNVGAPRLVSLKIGATRNFEVSIHSGGPDFEVVALAALRSKISRTKLKDSVVETEGL